MPKKSPSRTAGDLLDFEDLDNPRALAEAIRTGTAAANKKPEKAPFVPSFPNAKEEKLRGEGFVPVNRPADPRKGLDKFAQAQAYYDDNPEEQQKPPSWDQRLAGGAMLAGSIGVAPIPGIGPTIARTAGGYGLATMLGEKPSEAGRQAALSALLGPFMEWGGNKVASKVGGSKLFKKGAEWVAKHMGKTVSRAAPEATSIANTLVHPGTLPGAPAAEQLFANESTALAPKATGAFSDEFGKFNPAKMQETPWSSTPRPASYSEGSLEIPADLPENWWSKAFSESTSNARPPQEVPTINLSKVKPGDLGSAIPDFEEFATPTMRAPKPRIRGGKLR